MGKICVATIMTRHYLGSGMYAFSYNHAVTGKFDGETNIFTDTRGNEYLPITDTNLLRSEVPNGFVNLVEADKISGEDVQLGDAIRKYEKETRDTIYLVGLIDGTKTFIMPVQLKKMIEAAKENLKENKPVQDDEPMIDVNVSNFVADIENGVYDEEQLKQLRVETAHGIAEFCKIIKAINLRLDDGNLDMTDVNKILAASQGCQEKSAKEKQEATTIMASIGIKELLEKVTRTLIAQDLPAKKVITELFRKELSSAKKKEAILLTGPTGVGKTKLMELIGRYSGRVMYKLNATKLTMPGYVGADIEDVLYDLYRQCGYDKEKAENAIIFIDEIDKKGSEKNDDVSGKAVLNLFLSFIEGAEYTARSNKNDGPNTDKVIIDTTNMIIVAGGAFNDVYKHLQQKNELGFGGDVDKSKKPREATIEDFIKKGRFPDEFMGRVRVIKLNDLSAEDIKRVLLESDESQIRIQEEVFKKLGVSIRFTDDFSTEIASRAKKNGTGARGLSALIDEATFEALFEVSANPEEYEEITFGSETLDYPTKFQYVKRKKDTEN